MNERTPKQVRREIETERERLTQAVGALRGDAEVTLRSKLPLLAAGALGAGFLLSGGLGATMRLLTRRVVER